MRPLLPVLLLLAACQVEYGDVTHEDEDDEIVPAGPAPPESIVFARTELVDPVLPWDGVSLSEEVCAFYEGSAISGADMADIELLSMTLTGGHANTASLLPDDQELRIVGLYGTSGSYPSSSNVPSTSTTPHGSDGSWSATWTASSLVGMNSCSPDCYYSGFHLEMRIPWEDEQTPAVSCADFLEMELVFTWLDLSDGGSF